MEGCGNSNSVKEYRFVDKDVTYGTYYYRLKQIDIDGSFSYSNEVEVEVGSVSIEFRLEQNFPNPFNPFTSFDYSIPEKTEVIIKIFDSMGEEIKTLLSETKEAGRYSVDFNGGSFPSGVYFYRMHAGIFTDTKKFVLLK